MKLKNQQNSIPRSKTSTTKKVSKNFASLTIAEGVTRICAILLFIYIARILGVTSLGELAFATSLISFFTFFADFGLTTLGIREIARYKEETDSYGTNILLFQVLFTLLLIIILSILLPFMPISYNLKVLIFFYGLGLIPLALDMSYIFQGHEKMEYVLVGKAVTQVAYFILGFALISLFKNIIFVPIAAFISGVGGAVITYAILKRVLKFKLKKPDPKIFKLLIMTAIPFVVSEILVQVYRNVDVLMLQFTKSINEVGYYSSGYKIVNSIILLISLVSSSFFPLISFYFKHDKSQFKRSLLLFSQTTGLLSIPVATGAIIYARQILAFLYGNQLLAGTDAFKVLLLLVIVIPFRLVVVSIIVAADKQNHYMISGVIGTIINVTLNIILIPKYGMTGAGIAIVVTEAAVGIYSFTACFRLFDYSIDIVKKYFIKPTIAAIIMTLIAFNVPNMFVGIPLDTLVYFVVLFLIKGLPENLQINGNFNPAIFKQRVSLQLDQLASDSVVPATPTVNLTDIIPIDRSNSQNIVSQEVEMPAPPVWLEMLTRDERFHLSDTIPTPAAQLQTDSVSRTSEIWEDESSITHAITQQDEEPFFFFVSDNKEAETDWPEWLKSLGAETMEPEPEPEPELFVAQLGNLLSEPVNPAEATQPAPPDASLSLSEPGQSQWANLSDQVSAPEMPAHPTAEPVVAPGSNISRESPIPLASAYDDAMQEYRMIIRNAPELLDEVISNLRALLKLVPWYSTGYRVLGDAYMHQGEYIQAIEAYNKASTVARN